MVNEVNITNATLIILLEVNNELHMVRFKKGGFEMVDLFVKNNTEGIMKTNRTVDELVEFIGW